MNFAEYSSFSPQLTIDLKIPGGLKGGLVQVRVTRLASNYISVLLLLETGMESRALIGQKNPEPPSDWLTELVFPSLPWQ